MIVCFVVCGVGLGLPVTSGIFVCGFMPVELIYFRAPLFCCCCDYWLYFWFVTS